MTNNCISGLNTTRTSQISSGNAGIIYADIDENGRLILTKTDGTAINSESSNCCCSIASKNYVLGTILENAQSFDYFLIYTTLIGVYYKLKQTISSPSFNTNFYDTHPVTNVTAAINDILFFEFYPLNPDNLINLFNCDCSAVMPQCDTNIALETRLREVLSSFSNPIVFPASIPGNLTISIKNNPFGLTHIEKIYGICNGILWIYGSILDYYAFQAIPLCNVDYISYLPL